tara:strand:+ start:350500 stop:351249 length:750 start_codon:yes stop_codon:yes gene_type:complete
MSYTKRLKNRLKQNAIEICKSIHEKGEERKTGILFPSISLNFDPETYANINAKPDFKKRLDKSHPKAKGYKEMQSSNSSDALLMNIFSNPNILKIKGIRDLLGINKDDNIEFGWNPIFENERTKTEIDMKIGSTIFEAKLTEKDFSAKDIHFVLAYANVEELLDFETLIKEDKILHYQLIRNLLTANQYGFNFFLIVDETRTDLIRSFYQVKMAIKDKDLSSRFNFLTWQEITEKLGGDLKKYITRKYF